MLLAGAGARFSRSWVALGGSWVALRASWSDLGGSWGGLGSLLGALGSLLVDLGSLLGILRRSWVALGLLLRALGSLLGGLEGPRGPEGQRAREPVWPRENAPTPPPGGKATFGPPPLAGNTELQKGKKGL